MKGMLDPVFEEKVIGHAEVRQCLRHPVLVRLQEAIFWMVSSREMQGSYFQRRRADFRGELASLKRFKDDVKEVKAGYECGLVFDGFNDVKEEDKVEAYIMVEVPR